MREGKDFGEGEWDEVLKERKRIYNHTEEEVGSVEEEVFEREEF